MMQTNKIYNGDYQELIKQLPDNSIDLVVTDPPYQFSSQNPTGGGFMKKENKQHLVDIKNSFDVNFKPLPLLKQLKRVCKKFNVYIS